MENQNIGTNTQGADNAGNVQSQGAEGVQSSVQNERMFTQDDVNRIVSERLARAKGTQAGTGMTDREHELNQRERQLDARERLADLGISKDLLPLVNCTSKETMEESVKLIAGHFGKKVGSGYRIVSTSSTSGNTSGHSKEMSDDDIRAAMGLKGRK